MNKKIFSIFALLVFSFAFMNLTNAIVMPDPMGDYDNDGILNMNDNCYYVWNPNQLDSDEDGYGNVCDWPIDFGGYCGDALCGSDENSNSCVIDCSATCGNNIVEVGEWCDNDNEWCDSSCKVKPGWICTNAQGTYCVYVGNGTNSTEECKIDIDLLLDKSASINSTSFALEKTIAKTFAEKVLDGEYDNLMGVSAFNHIYNNEEDLTNDLTDVLNAIDGISSPMGSTNLNASIRESTDKLLDQGRDGFDDYIVLLSDGRPTVPYPNCQYDYNTTYCQQQAKQATRDAVDYAKNNNVIILTIGFGEDLDEDFLTEIATETGGQYFPSDLNEEDLDEAYENALKFSCQNSNNNTNNSICGNNIWEPGEQCDNNHEWCDSSCKVKPGWICTDAHGEYCVPINNGTTTDDLSSSRNHFVQFCDTNWECTGWSECYNGVKTRSCIDRNFCPDQYNQPIESTGCQVGLNQSLVEKDYTSLIFWILVALALILLIILIFVAVR